MYLDVNFHRVTLDRIMRDAMKKRMSYKQDVRISLREYQKLRHAVTNIVLFISDMYTLLNRI